MSVALRKSVGILSYSGQYFPYSVRMRENADQNTDFSRSVAP